MHTICSGGHLQNNILLWQPLNVTKYFKRSVQTISSNEVSSNSDYKFFNYMLLNFRASNVNSPVHILLISQEYCPNGIFSPVVIILKTPNKKYIQFWIK